MVDTLNGRASVLRDLEKLKDRADRSLNMFHKEKHDQGKTQARRNTQPCTEGRISPPTGTGWEETGWLPALPKRTWGYVEAKSNMSKQCALIPKMAITQQPTSGVWPIDWGKLRSSSAWCWWGPGWTQGPVWCFSRSGWGMSSEGYEDDRDLNHITLKERLGDPRPVLPVEERKGSRSSSLQLVEGGLQIRQI